MRWVSVLSQQDNYEEAVAECVAQLEVRFTTKIDLLMVFPTNAYLEHAEELLHLLQLELEPNVLLGCGAAGTLGGCCEVEGRPALSLMAASLPGIHLTPFHLSDRDLETQIDLEKFLGFYRAEFPEILMLADPFTFHIEEGLGLLDFHYPGCRKIGGLVSGCNSDGQQVMFLDGRVIYEGMVGLALSGNIVMETLVAQGCRPLGNPMFVTRCNKNVLIELNGVHVREVLSDLYATADERDKDLLRHSLFLGMETRPKATTYTQGDFLVRNIIGTNTAGHLAINSELTETGVVQFQVRDADASHADLEAHLGSYLARHGGRKATGALMFACLGRGVNLYGRPNYDTDLIASHLGEVPLAGMFCNGEIGPVQGQTYVHAYTSCIAIFHAKQRQAEAG